MGGPSDEEPPSNGAPDEIDDVEETTDSGRPEGTTNRVLRFARRLMDRRELAEDTKDLLYAVLSTSDKAKTEAVRMVAREVRNYLSELRLKEDLMELARSHSLEISISLKPLTPAPEGSEDDGASEDQES
ncbi:MAG: hypothetical protein KTR31_00845 [Myxococcales bacterium]|nr:hypothetical protein [Myxococcales bacterium]